MHPPRPIVRTTVRYWRAHQAKALAIAGVAQHKNVLALLLPYHTPKIRNRIRKRRLTKNKLVQQWTADNIIGMNEIAISAKTKDYAIDHYYDPPNHLLCTFTCGQSKSPKISEGCGRDWLNVWFSVTSSVNSDGTASFTREQSTHSISEKEIKILIFFVKVKTNFYF